MSALFIDYQHLSNETHFFPKLNTSLSVSISYVGIYPELFLHFCVLFVTKVKQG